ncbi:MAG: TldD/PmbA family protein [Sphingomonadales bacterium]|nr:TldD/PmbA family protein [Sphingomonadales bacterium]PIX67179.1 MAG: modulator protein [Sphingomonadales bacterium CG_4_10_14_3_um_filter_58_15]NCO50106.1 TldD/PmbA family protein [Sphingomonadales bacterium]NCO99541.1 TldD/PmbA family protein [Sphingomonadales bacterium]NCP27669.1 TldD/PmbA family protein [Sphingomonadales bacterium]
MLKPSEAQDRADALISQAKKAGADAADAIYVCDASTQVQMRLGNLEDVERSEGEEIGLRVFVGKRSATVSSSDMDPVILSALVGRALDMAKEAPEDQYAGLAPEELLLKTEPHPIEGDDGQNPEPELLRELALKAEDAARSVAGVTNSEGGGASAGRSIVAVATSHGFSGSYSTSGYSLSASVIAGEGDGMERDYAYDSTRFLEDMQSPEKIGREAGERAVSRLNPVNFQSGAMPVVYDPRVGNSLLGHFIGAISGSAIARKTSFLLDALDTEVFDSALTIIDCPHRKRGLRSKAFDGEGLPTAKTKLIDNGRLTQWIMESASARQLGLQPTGHASRGVGGAPGVSVTNLHMGNGSVSQAELIKDIKHGVYITELIGMGVNPVTGDYSRGAGGFLITDGEIGPPVSEITIAGNLKDMFKSLIAADDLEYRYSVNVPTLRTDSMTVAGG